MQRVSIIFLVSFIFMLPVNAELITGGIEYNTDSAREYLNNSKLITIPNNILKAHIIDINRDKNIAALLKGVTELNDRTLAYFSDGSYGIIYKDEPKYVWYYDKNGNLTHHEVKSSLEYPYRTYKYNSQGKLVNMSLRVSKDETFIFDTSQKLIAHWIGKYCYDENKNIIMTRKILE